MPLITYNEKNSIGLLTLNRPEARNALNTALLQELDEQLSQVAEERIRCLIITGAGEAFAAGEDIDEMAEKTREEALAYSQFGSRVFQRLESLPIPVIAAVNGWALGGGCELALACDIRIAAETAIFSLPETAMGITPGFGGSQRLARITGEAKAKELIFTARRIRGSEALQIGLVNQLHPKQYLMEEACAMAAEIAENAPLAVRAAKESIRDGVVMEMDQALALESELFAGCFESEDQRSAMTAFVEKREHKKFIGA